MRLQDWVFLFAGRLWSHSQSLMTLPPLLVGKGASVKSSHAGVGGARLGFRVGCEVSVFRTGGQVQTQTGCGVPTSLHGRVPEVTLV